MSGTGHSYRFKSSISNRNNKSAFQVLAPWNARKLGKAGQVPVTTGGGDLYFSSDITVDSVTLSGNSLHFLMEDGGKSSISLDSNGCLSHTVNDSSGIQLSVPAPDPSICFNHGIMVKGSTSISGPLAVTPSNSKPTTNADGSNGWYSATVVGNDTAGNILICMQGGTTSANQTLTVTYSTSYKSIPSLIWSISVEGFNTESRPGECFQSLFYVKNQSEIGFQIGWAGDGDMGTSTTAPVVDALDCYFNYLVISLD